MSAVPGDGVPESGDIGGQPRQPQPALDELKSSAQWLEHAALVGGDLVRLAGMELRLAAGDSGRMLLLALAMIPVAILAWTGLSVLLAWLVFIWLESVAWGIVGFIALQLVMLGAVAAYCRKLSASLRFPATRRQLNALKEQIHGTQDTAETDSTAG